MALGALRPARGSARGSGTGSRRPGGSRSGTGVALRGAATHAIHLAKETVDIAYEACGSDAIFERHPIQQRFQDIHTITQHLQGRLAHYETIGQFALGLEPDRQWL